MSELNSIIWEGHMFNDELNVPQYLRNIATSLVSVGYVSKAKQLKEAKQYSRKYANL
jgi:hypothetical protein